MVAAAIGCAVVLGASATAASAAPAAFSTTGPLTMSLTSTLVIKIGTTPTPATTVTCTTTALLDGGVTNFGAPVQGAVTAFRFAALHCVTGVGQPASVPVADMWGHPMYATKSGSVYSLSGNTAWDLIVAVGAGSYESIPTVAASYSARWYNNAVGAAPSILMFNNAPIGRVTPGYPLGGQPITLTATFSVSQGGGPITLI